MRGKGGLDRGSYVAAVVGHDDFAQIQGKRDIHLLPTFCRPFGCQARPEDGLEGIPCFIRGREVSEREVKVEVIPDLLVAVFRAQFLLFERTTARSSTFSPFSGSERC